MLVRIVRKKVILMELFQLKIIYKKILNSTVN